MALEQLGARADALAQALDARDAQIAALEALAQAQSKQIGALRGPPAAGPPPGGGGGACTLRRYAGAMRSAAESDALLRLLHMYGPHYAAHFAPDMVARVAPGGVGGIFGTTAFRVADAPGAPLRVDAASHACVIHDPERLDVGLFGAVITDPAYRRRGLSKRVVGQVIADWDAKGGRYLVLGTGSPHAAKMYQSHGFAHLAGGLDAGKKGYNPDDQGEWIMIRPPGGGRGGGNSVGGSSSNGSSSTDGGFDAATFYATAPGAAASASSSSLFVAEPLQRKHWAELCVLFNAFPLTESDRASGGKFPAAQITDGIAVEEQMVALINASCQRKDRGRRVFVAVSAAAGPSHGRIFGIGTADEPDGTPPSQYVVPGAAAAAVRAVLERAATKAAR